MTIRRIKNVERDQDQFQNFHNYHGTKRVGLYY